MPQGSYITPQGMLVTPQGGFYPPPNFYLPPQMYHGQVPAYMQVNFVVEQNLVEPNVRSCFQQQMHAGMRIQAPAD